MFYCTFYYTCDRSLTSYIHVKLPIRRLTFTRWSNLLLKFRESDNFLCQICPEIIYTGWLKITPPPIFGGILFWQLCMCIRASYRYAKFHLKCLSVVKMFERKFIIICYLDPPPRCLCTHFVSNVFAHRRRSSVNFRGRGKTFLPEKYVRTINKIPEFYAIFVVRKCPNLT